MLRGRVLEIAQDNSFRWRGLIEDETGNSKMKLDTTCALPFLSACPSDCSLITFKTVGSIPVLHINLSFVPLLSLTLIDPRRRAKTNKWNLLHHGGFLFKQISALFAGQRTEAYNSILVKVNPGSFIAVLACGQDVPAWPEWRLICHSLARPAPVVLSVRLVGIAACTTPGLLRRDGGSLSSRRSNLVHK